MSDFKLKKYKHLGTYLWAIGV